MKRYAARYATYGAALGAMIGAVLAAGAWSEFTIAGHYPAFMLEAMSFVFAPPFRLPLSYPIGALTGLYSYGRSAPPLLGVAAWCLLTPIANWALVGVIVGAIRNIRASNAAHRASRPSV